MVLRKGIVDERDVRNAARDKRRVIGPRLFKKDRIAVLFIVWFPRVAGFPKDKDCGMEEAILLQLFLRSRALLQQGFWYVYGHVWYILSTKLELILSKRMSWTTLVPL